MRAFDGTPVATSCWPSTSWPGASIATGSATTVRCNAVRVYQLPGTVGMIAPIEGDDGWLLGAGRGFVYLALDGSHRSIAEVAPAGTRMNDGACDPQGRFWAGTVADDHHEGGGTLYRLDTNGRTDVMLEGLTISNGIGWSPDGRTMYLIDSGPRRHLCVRVRRDPRHPRRPARPGHRPRRRRRTRRDDRRRRRRPLGGDLRRWVRPPLHARRPPARGAARSGRAEHVLRLRRPRSRTGSTSPRQPRTGPTSNATPSRPPGTSTASTPDTTGRPAAPFRPDPSWWAKWRGPSTQ